jgi:hypothetical protein
MARDYGPPSPKKRGEKMPQFGDKDYYKMKDRRSLPPVDPPPTYRDLGGKRRPDGSRPDNREMADTGWPRGVSNDRNGSANRWGEWQPGEFERSYPKSDPKNAAWYKTHRYVESDGRWARVAGPPSPVEKAGPRKPPAAAKAVAKAAANKGKK